MKKKTHILPISQIQPGTSNHGIRSTLSGGSHPPQNSSALSAHINMTLAYSPSQKSAKLIDEYSVWWPATSSLSASTRSNGVRKVSAIELIRNTTHIGNSKGLNTKPLSRPNTWPFWASTMALKLKLLAHSTTVISTKPIETS